MSLEDYGVIVDLRPSKEGWRYIQTYQGAEHRIPYTGSASSGAELVQLVTDFRAQNGIPIGDPEFEVAKFIKLASPLNDRFKGGNPGQPRFRQIEPLIDEVRREIERVEILKPKFVLQTEAIERGEICLKCKHNVKWETQCGECNEKVRYKGALLRKSESLAMDDGLKACRLHKLHLPSFVFLDRDVLPQRHEQAPAECWVKK